MEDLNQLKLVLVKCKRTNKWLAETSAEFGQKFSDVVE